MSAKSPATTYRTRKIDSVVSLDQIRYPMPGIDHFISSTWARTPTFGAWMRVSMELANYNRTCEHRRITKIDGSPSTARCPTNAQIAARFVHVNPATLLVALRRFS